MNLQDLGFTKEELQQRVVDQCCDTLLSGKFQDEEGNEYSSDSSIAKQLNAAVKQRVDRAISDIADTYIIPNAKTYIENVALQATNQWGEKKGVAMTFREYMVQRAEAYLNEQVDHAGKSKGEDSYGWSGKQTRITFLVHQHLQYQIAEAMKSSMANANKVIVDGIQETVKLKLNEIAKGLQFTVTAPR